MLGLVTYNIYAIYLGLNADGFTIDSITSNFTRMSILIMVVINIVGYFGIIFSHLCTHPKLVWKLMSGTFSYWYYQGAYMQTMVAHAFCNVDDVSWGTKGSTGSHGGKGYETEKVFFVSGWYLFVYVGCFGIRYWPIFSSMWTSWWLNRTQEQAATDV
jgi:cellulose synthase/poly-beta-1,6-N-acetylglucosamine synthase-like glycosyltransferase